jgi:hypothetical protein
VPSYLCNRTARRFGDRESPNFFLPLVQKTGAITVEDLKAVILQIDRYYEEATRAFTSVGSTEAANEVIALRCDRRVIDRRIRGAGSGLDAL